MWGYLEIMLAFAYQKKKVCCMNSFSFGERTFQKTSAAVVAVLALLSTESALPAQSAPAVDFTAQDAFNNVEADTLGWKFIVSAPILVTALGYYDYSSDSSQPSVHGTPDNRTSGGLLDNHVVGLFDSAGNLLTSVDVLSGTSDALIGNCRYSSIPTIELTSGTYFVEGTQQGTSETNPTDPVAWQFSSLNPLPEITILGAYYHYGGTPGDLEFPNIGPTYQAYLGPNFLASTVPEPTSMLLMLAAGLGALIAFRRRLWILITATTIETTKVLCQKYHLKIKKAVP